MMHVILPKRPVPATLEKAVQAAREARDKAYGDPARQGDLPVLEAALMTAADAIQAHYASVGTEVIPIPKEVESSGPAAIQGHVASQIHRLASEAKEDAEPSKSRRGAREE